MFYQCKGGGRITAADPIYYQLKVWQDFNRHYKNSSYKQPFHVTQRGKSLENRELGASKRSIVPILGINTFGTLNYMDKQMANNQKRRSDPQGQGIRIDKPWVRNLIAAEVNIERIYLPNLSPVNDSTWRTAA